MKNESKKEKNLIQRNIELSTEFSRYLFEHPDLESKLPADAEIVLLPEYDKELRDYNIKTGIQMESEGQKVQYIRITNLRPKELSRIENVELE